MSNIQDLLDRQNGEEAETVTTPETTPPKKTKAKAAPAKATPVEVIEEQAAPPAAEPVQAAPTLAPETSTEVAPIDHEQSTAVSLMDSGIGEIGGEIASTDLIIPRIIQVHGVGDLSHDYDPGTAVLGAGGDLFPLVELPEDKEARRKHSEPFTFIPLKAVKVFREYFDYNNPAHSELMPREFITASEMIGAGGKESYDPKPAGPGHFRPALNLLCAMVKKTSEVSDEMLPFFCDTFGDESFCICMWRLQKSAYSSAGKTLVTDAQRALRKTGLLSGRYAAMFENQKRGANYVWCPVVSLAKERNSAEVVEFLTQLVSG